MLIDKNKAVETLSAIMQLHKKYATLDRPFETGYVAGLEVAVKTLNKMDSETAKTEKTGMWVEYNRSVKGLFGLYQPYHSCTVCGYSDYGTVEYGDRYCGNCGARMANGGGWQKKRRREDGNCNP